jgi:hypothetical protein
VSPRVPQLQTHLLVREGSVVATCHRAHRPTGKGSGVTTCPMTPDLPPSVGGLRRCHMPPGPPSCREGLQCCHVSCSSRPASRCGWALASPRAPWLSASEACLCVPKAPDIRLIMASPATQSRHRIKCVQDKSYAVYG